MPPIIRIAAWLTALYGALGCVRVVGPAPSGSSAVPKLAGERCGDAAECDSGLCLSGVCCEHACAPTESCELPTAPGFCTRRDLGDACESNAQCPSGFCQAKDRVCCDAACSGTCESCVNTGREGQCGLADDNTDVRGDCTAPCTACFVGYCLPAAPGTNPRNQCGLDGACDALAACAAAPGHVCGANRSCAVGNCMLGVCLQARDGQVLAPALNNNAWDRYMQGVAEDASGRTLVLVRELESAGTNTVYIKDVLLRSNGSNGWDALVLPTRPTCEGSRVTFLAQSLLVVGTQAVVVSEWFPGICQFEEGRVEVQWVGLDLTAGQRYRLEGGGPITGERGVRSLATVFDGTAITVAMSTFDNGDVQDLWISRYGLARGSWEHSMQSQGDARGTTAITQAGGVAYVVYGADELSDGSLTSLVVASVNGVTVKEEERVAIPQDCLFFSVETQTVGAAAPWLAIVGRGAALDPDTGVAPVLWAEFHPDAPSGSRFSNVECVPPPPANAPLQVRPVPLTLDQGGAVLMVDLSLSALTLAWRAVDGTWMHQPLRGPLGDTTLVSSVVTASSGQNAVYGMQLYDIPLDVPQLPVVGVLRP